jgi:ABC-type lipoprotein release transport system permease subunit
VISIRMAWRNLWRNPRRSLATLGAMTFALWVMVLYSGLVEGYMRGMERGIRELEVGDLQVFAPGYLDRPSLYTAIRHPGPVLGKLEAAGFAASPRLLAGGLVARGEESAGVSLRGLDASREARVSALPAAVGSGTWLDPGDPSGVVIGARLARTLGASPGTELVVVTQGADGSLANDRFHVRGVLKSVSDTTDRSAVLMNEAAFRDLLVMPEGVHQLIVRRPEHMELARAAEFVRAVAPNLDTRTWRELMPTVASMLDSSRSLVLVVFGTVYLAVSILVLNSTLMIVFERVREFGLLKALGVGPFGVLGLVLLENGLEMALALTVGLALSWPGIHYLSRVGIDVGRLGGLSVLGHAMPPIWYGVYSWWSLIGPTVVLIAMVLLGLLYPALKAARIRPAAAMRHL